MLNDKKVNTNLTEDEIENIGQYGNFKGPLIKRLLPKKLWLAYNQFIYKYDAELERLEEIVDKFFKPITSPYYKLKRFYDDHFYRTFSHRIPQAFRYAKIGWYDHDWDYHYFLRLVTFKLERMEKCIRQYNRHVGTHDYCDQMKLALDCLKRFTEDAYILEPDKELKKLFPEESKKDEDFLTRLKGEKEVSLNKDGEKRVFYVHKHRETSDEYRDAWRRLHFYYDKVRIADLRVAFHIMTPYIRTTYEKFEEDCKKLRELNEEAYNKDPDNFEERNFHNGIYSWWD